MMSQLTLNLKWQKCKYNLQGYLSAIYTGKNRLFDSRRYEIQLLPQDRYQAQKPSTLACIALRHQPCKTMKYSIPYY